MRFFGLFVILCAGISAQVTQSASANGAAAGAASAPEAPKPEVKPEDKCSVEGTAVNALTGEPIRKVHLTLREMSGQSPVSYGADSDAGGKFMLENVDPGRYTFYASRNGFVNQSYSPQGKSRRTALLTLANGQKMKDITFKLTPQGVISGRIVDEDGDPLARAQVQCMMYMYVRGKKQLLTRDGATTNDLGEFRLFGLGPGRYVLSASYQPLRMYMMLDSPERPAGGQPEEGYATTYYPNAPDAESASRIEVSAGAQIQGLTMTLRRTRVATVRGRVTLPGNSSANGIMLELIQRGNESFLNRRMARTQESKGTFTITGVAPGSYYLAGNANDGDKRYVARMPVEVGDQDVDGLQVNFQPPLELSGHVVAEDNGDLKGLSMNIFLQPKERDPMTGGSNARVKDDLTFHLDSLRPAQYDINVYVPQGFYLKSVRMGDQDVTFDGVDLSQGTTGGEMTVVLNPNGGEIDGDVQNSKGEKAVGASVTLIPDESHRQASWLYKNASTDQNGHFTIKGVRPGDYTIYAWDDIPNGAYQDPDFIKPHESAGQKITVKEKDKQNLQLTSIAADDSGEAQ